MKTNTYYTYSLKRALSTGLIAGIITAVFYSFFNDPHPLIIRNICGFLIGFTIAVTIMFNYSFANKRLARLVLPLSVLVNTLIVLALVFFIPLLYHMLFGLFNFELTLTSFHNYIASPEFALGTGFGTLMTMIFTFLHEISLLIGPSTFWKFITGRYHKPREENVAVMFLDLNDSTAIAEKLGEITFLSFVSDFFRDISEALIMTKAQIIKYVGDEAIIIWPQNTAFRDDNCYRCFHLAKQSISRKSAYYLKRYGRVPDFKAGLHYGPVVFGEVGVLLKEIACLGDVLNTAARITSECREKKEAFLISNDAASRLSVFPTLVSVGDVRLRGKEKAIALYGAPAKL